MAFHLVISLPKEGMNQVSEYTAPQLPITYEQCQQLMDIFKPPISELESSANQVSSFTNQESKIPIQGETSTNLISAGNISITSQLSNLDSKHSVFASSSSLTQQNSLTNSVNAPWIFVFG